MGIIILPLGAFLFLGGGFVGLAMLWAGLYRSEQRLRDVGLLALSLVLFGLLALVGPFAIHAGADVSAPDFLLQFWVFSGGLLLLTGAVLFALFLGSERSPVAMVGSAASLVAASVPYAYFELLPTMKEWFSITTHP